MSHWIFVLVQKDSNSQKGKFLLHGKIPYQIYHCKQEDQKRKSEFFYRDNFVLP
jgi:hypothetical protein